jgi:small subunit ribosomal protein S20
MPTSKQAAKRLRQSQDARLRNKVKRTSMRSAIKNVLRAANRAEGEQALLVATKRIDKAAKENIIHHNAASRYKSRLSKRVAAIAN